ncbi:hypothetical protein [Pseudomonas sp. MWU16-30322]|uniref:hypothetical protein n=1 Tax=Pseudomonas sp. MWU16-30322 TaxID=2878092 RepID=UPI001CF9BE88|nr:hypothetical protein [Pseudomonas sp. MWU16-30322]
MSIKGSVYATKPVGAGLPAMALVDPTSLLTDPALSRASPLPQWMVLISGSVYTAKPVGAGLAREGGGTLSIQDSLVSYSINKPKNHFLIFYRY